MPDQEREKYLKEISLLHAENATLKEEVALMQSQLDWFKKQMFGRKTEQSTVIFEGGEQLSLMQDEKAVSEKTSEETITVPEHKRRKKRTFEEAMADLPVEKVIHELEDKTCDKCGAEMEEIGEEKRISSRFTSAKNAAVIPKRMQSLMILNHAILSRRTVRSL